MTSGAVGADAPRLAGELVEPLQRIGAAVGGRALALRLHDREGDLVHGRLDDRQRLARLVFGALREGDGFGEVIERVARLAKTCDVVRLVRHGGSPWDDVIEEAHHAASRTSGAGSAT